MALFNKNLSVQHQVVKVYSLPKGIRKMRIFLSIGVFFKENRVNIKKDSEIFTKEYLTNHHLIISYLFCIHLMHSRVF